MMPRASYSLSRSPPASADAASCGGTCEAPVRAARAGTAACIAAATSATAIAACGACCVIPLAFPAIAAAVGVSALGWFWKAHLWMTVLAVIVVTAAWIWVWRQRSVHRRRLSAATFALMGIASAGALLATAWPYVEPFLTGALLK
jgi:hypothetical protein